MARWQAVDKCLGWFDGYDSQSCSWGLRVLHYWRVGKQILQINIQLVQLKYKISNFKHSIQNKF
jgi:hypothetical protein